MLDPYLKQSSDGEWICTWKLNDHDGYGQATSKDLINWTSQKYPRTTPDFDGVRVKAIVAGEEQKGNINRVVWTLVDGLDKNYSVQEKSGRINMDWIKIMAGINIGTHYMENVRYRMENVLPV